MDMVRSINPGVIMNNRLYAYSGLNRDQAGTLDLRCGDYITPERFIPRRGYPGVDWESCMTVSDKWGYNRYDTNIKSPETVIEKLVECVTKGGNLLLNVNPMGGRNRSGKSGRHHARRGPVAQDQRGGRVRHAGLHGTGPARLHQAGRGTSSSSWFRAGQGTAQPPSEGAMRN